LSVKSCPNIVIPAKAGIQGMAKISGLFVEKWIPAFAGMTGKCLNYRFFSSLLEHFH